MDLSLPDDHGERVERLLDEVQATAGPVAWPRVEALVTALVDLYGEGVARIVRLARAAARDPADLDASFSDDELVASLLLLYELHPRSSELNAAGSLHLERHSPAPRPPREAPLVSVERLVRSGRP